MLLHFEKAIQLVAHTVSPFNEPLRLLERTQDPPTLPETEDVEQAEVVESIGNKPANPPAGWVAVEFEQEPTKAYFLKVADNKSLGQVVLLQSLPRRAAKAMKMPPINWSVTHIWTR